MSRPFTPFGPPLLLAGSPRPGGNCDAAAGIFAKAAGRDRAEPFAPTFLRSYRIEPCTGCSACTKAAEHWARTDAAGREAQGYSDAAGREAQGYSDAAGREAQGYSDAAGREAQGYSDAAGREAQGYSDAAGRDGAEGCKDAPTQGDVEGRKGAASQSSATGGITPTPGAGPAFPSGLAFGCPLTMQDDSAALLRALCTAKSLCIVAPIFFYHLPALLKALIDRTQPFWALKSAGDTRFSEMPARLCHVILIAGRPRGEKLFEGSLLTLKQAFASLNIRLAEPLLLRGLDGPGDLEADAAAVRAIEEYGKKAGESL